jgi:hypothetical protein
MMLAARNVAIRVNGICVKQAKGMPSEKGVEIDHHGPDLG